MSAQRCPVRKITFLFTFVRFLIHRVPVETNISNVFEWRQIKWLKACYYFVTCKIVCGSELANIYEEPSLD